GPPQSAVIPPMPGAYMTCMEMSRNGVRIFMQLILQVLLLTLKDRSVENSACCVAARSTMNTSVLLTVAGPCLKAAALPLASEWRWICVAVGKQSWTG